MRVQRQLALNFAWRNQGQAEPNKDGRTACKGPPARLGAQSNTQQKAPEDAAGHIPDNKREQHAATRPQGRCLAVECRGQPSTSPALAIGTYVV